MTIYNKTSTTSGSTMALAAASLQQQQTVANVVIRERGALCRALYNNHPEAKNELGFRKGDILTVIEYDHEGQSGWWLCTLRGQRGICPSNYLEVLEDSYSNVPPKSSTNPNGSTFSLLQKDEPETQHQKLGEDGKGTTTLSSTACLERQTSTDSVNPLETYDFPRTVEPLPLRPLLSSNLTSLANSTTSLRTLACSTSPSCSQISLRHSQDDDEAEQHIYVNDVLESPEENDGDRDEPLYQNDSVVAELAVLGIKEEEEHAAVTEPNPLDLYDVPRCELPILGQSLSRLRKYGSCSTGDELSTAASRTSEIPKFLQRGKSASSLALGCVSTNGGGTGGSGVQLRRPPRGASSVSFLARSNRSSVQSESADSGIIMASCGGGKGGGITTSNGKSLMTMHHHHQMGPPDSDLYDVPRGTVHPVRGAVNGGGSSRPPSALSMTSSGMGLSIATSDSKDSLDGLYDVPKSAMKTYVNHMEAKYDDVRRQRHDSSSSTGSRSSQQTGGGGGGSVKGGHTRHNSTSSIFSAYGFSRKQDSMNLPPPSFHYPGSRQNSVNGSNGQMSLDEMYDVPRGSCAHPPPPRPPSRPSTACSRESSNGSLNSEDPMQFYDVPSQFARKVGFSEHGVSNSSLASSASSQFRMTGSSTIINGGSHINNGFKSQPSTNGSDGRKLEDVDVKILPLGPKAAVSVCEKLRHEVVSSITTILSNVKPKWRTKENLTQIMPDLKFSCTRLCLAIKDIADFATRSLSNAKRLPDNNIIERLRRLLTPVINGSQIVQRDVDELDAYFWSVDRLSMSGGDLQHSSSFMASGNDALDQLILCSRSLKHDVTELANFLALHSTSLYSVASTVGTINNGSSKPEQNSTQVSSNNGSGTETTSETSTTVVVPETKVDDTQDDYDYVRLVSNTPVVGGGPASDAGSNSNSTNSQKLSCSALSTSSSTSTVSWHLDPLDQQLLEFYSAQISVTAPQLSQSIGTFISAIQQNEPPSVFNIHLKYVILLAYKLLFAGDTVHRNIANVMLKEEVESRANDLHKSILTLYEASKIATVEFPKIAPMQMIVDRVWATTQASTQLKKCIFNAIYTSV